MQVSLDTDYGHHSIHSYSEGEVIVSIPVKPDDTVIPLHDDQPVRLQERLTSSLIIHPDGLIRDWRPCSVKDLNEGNFAPLAGLEREILLLGTGQRLCWPDPVLLSRLQQQGVGVEVMDTPAACRTYNILMSDQRRVAAALILAETT